MTAGQAAQKTCGCRRCRRRVVTAGQAAQKTQSCCSQPLQSVTAGQAAQKSSGPAPGLGWLRDCRTGSSEIDQWRGLVGFES